MEPCGEGRVTAEGGNFAMKLEESFLSQVLGLSGIADHAQAQGVDAALVLEIKMREGLVVSSLSASEQLGVCRRNSDSRSRSPFDFTGRGFFLRRQSAIRRIGSRHA